MMVQVASAPEGSDEPPPNNNTNMEPNNNNNVIQVQPQAGSSSHQSSESVASVLTCCICHQLFQDPYRTACMHAFCFGCIDPMLRINPNVPCPLCRSTPITPLKRDFMLIQLKEELTGIKVLPKEEEPSGADGIYGKPTPPIFAMSSSSPSPSPSPSPASLPATVTYPSPPLSYTPAHLQSPYQSPNQSPPAVINASAYSPPPSPIRVAPAPAPAHAAPVEEVNYLQQFRVEDIMRRESLLLNDTQRGATVKNYRLLMFRCAVWTSLVVLDNIIKWFIYADAHNFQKLHNSGKNSFNFQPLRDAYLVFCIYSSLCTLMCLSTIFPINIPYYPTEARRLEALEIAPWKAPFIFFADCCSRNQTKITRVQYWVGHESRVGREIMYFCNSTIALLIMNALMLARGGPTPYLIIGIILDGIFFFHFFVYGDNAQATGVLLLLYKTLQTTNGSPEAILNHLTNLSGTDEWGNWTKIKYKKFDDTAKHSLMTILNEHESGVGPDVLGALLILLYGIGSQGTVPQYAEAATIRALYDQTLRADLPS